MQVPHNNEYAENNFYLISILIAIVSFVVFLGCV